MNPRRLVPSTLTTSATTRLPIGTASSWWSSTTGFRRFCSSSFRACCLPLSPLCWSSSCTRQMCVAWNSSRRYHWRAFPQYNALFTPDTCSCIQVVSTCMPCRRLHVFRIGDKIVVKRHDGDMYRLVSTCILSVCLSVCPSVCMSLCLSVCPSRAST